MTKKLEKKYNLLTPIKEVISKTKDKKWLFHCNCGQEKEILLRHVKGGATKSCGCLKLKKISNLNKTHGLSNHYLYNIWLNLKNRCNNTKQDNYNNYGGRGITVCETWKNDFQSFYDWSIKNGYKEKLEIDRIDVNKGYYPENCRWITHKKNCNNTRTNIFLTYNNKTQTIAEWAEELKVSYYKIYFRYKRGWSMENIFNV